MSPSPQPAAATRPGSLPPLASAGHNATQPMQLLACYKPSRHACYALCVPHVRALKHQFVDQDPDLRRMLPKKPASARRRDTVWLPKQLRAGLVDPDFTKNSDRDTPFRPSADKSITPWLLALLLVAGLLYAGYQSIDWGKGKPSPDKVPTATTSIPTPQPNQPQAPSTEPRSRTVTKCTGGGKTTYSDGDCPQGSATSQLVTKADHNLVAGLTPEQLAAAKRLDAQAATAATVAENSPVVTNTSECKSLDAQIANLDAMARQPQSMQVHDWIRDQRKKARDRQFVIRC